MQNQSNKIKAIVLIMLKGYNKDVDKISFFYTQKSGFIS